MKIDGKRLQGDRALRKVSRAAVEKAAEERGLFGLSQSSIQRAETNGEWTEQQLRAYCEIVGLNYWEYIIGREIKEENNAFAEYGGEWTAFYFETDVDDTPYLAWDTLTIRQWGSKFEAHYVFDGSFHPERYKRSSVYRAEGWVNGVFLGGEYQIPSSNGWHGHGSLLISMIRSDTTAQGYCSFVGDDNVIACSEHFLIKKAHHNMENIRTCF